MNHDITFREWATIFAALRYWQKANGDHDSLARHRSPEHFEDHPPLTTDEIDALCERINGPGIMPWDNNFIQFPRLLAEIAATVEISTDDMRALCESMDLDPDRIDDLFERAQAEWEHIKQGGQPSRMCRDFPNTGPLCHECGEPYFTDESGVNHHIDEDNPDGINYEADMHHVPFGDDEED